MSVPEERAINVFHEADQRSRGYNEPLGRSLCLSRASNREAINDNDLKTEGRATFPHSATRGRRNYKRSSVDHADFDHCFFPFLARSAPLRGLLSDNCPGMRKYAP